jgi:Transglycosylase SLT domain
MAVTSLGFNIFSTYNGSGLNRAQRDMRGMNSTVRANSRASSENSKVTRALSAVHSMLARTVRSASSALNSHSRAARVAAAASGGLRRAVTAASSALNVHGRVTRLAAAAHRALSRDVNRSTSAHNAHTRAARNSSSATTALTARTRALGGASNGASGGVRRLGGSMNSAGGSSRLLRVALIGTTLATSGLGHAALAAGGAFVAMASGAAAAGGIFGIVMVSAAKRAFELQKAGARLNSAQKSWISSTHALSTAWKSFLDRTSSKTLAPAAIAVHALAGSINKLTPIINAVAPIAMRVARAFARWTVADTGLKRLVSTIVKYGVPALSHLVQAGRNMLAVLGFAFRALAPLGVRLAAALERGSLALRQWAAGGGFSRFVASAKTNLPGVIAFLKALGAAFKQVAIAMGGLGPLALGLATNLLRIVAALPIPVLQAMIVMWLIYKATMIATTAATALNTAATWLLGNSIAALRIRLAALALWQGICRIATLAYAAAQWVLNAAFLASPITWLVLGLVILVGAIIYLATQTRFFQTVWHAVWNGIRVFSLLVWHGLTIAWRAMVMSIVIVWRVVGAALRVAWRVTWSAMGVAARAIWRGLRAAWHGTVVGFITIWRVVSAGLRVAWRATWSGMGVAAKAIWKGLRAAWRATVLGFITIWRVVGAGLRASWRATWHAMSAAARVAWAGMKAGWRGFLRAMHAIGRASWSAMKAGWRGFWHAMHVVAAAVWTGIRNGWRGFLHAMHAIGRASWTAIRNGWRGFWNVMKAIGLAAGHFIERAWGNVRKVMIAVSRAMWSAIKGIFSSGSRWIRSTFWGPLRSFFLHTMPGAFSAAVRAIGRAWSALKGFISRPVKAIVDVVYNNGIVKLWNKVAGAFGAPKLSDFHFKGFKKGGYTGNGSTNDVAGVVHGQEYVIPANQLKKMGGPQVVQSLQDGTWGQGGAGVGPKISTSRAGAWQKEQIPGHYKGMFSGGVGGAGGGPIDDGDDGGLFGGIFSGIGDFFKSVGGNIKNAFSATAGFSLKILKELGGLTMGFIAPIANPLIQAVADKGKGLVKGIIPGSPGLEQMFAGGGKSKGMIQYMADIIKDWITANDAIAGCGFTPFRDWQAGDGERVSMGGVTVDRRTALMLMKAQTILKEKLSLTQGSFSSSVGASAGTHSGGGAVDINGPSDKKVGALRAAGFAAWNRGSKWGSPSFAPHIHAIAVGNKNLSAQARQQVQNFKAGKNGLAGGGKDNFNDSSCSGAGGGCGRWKPMAAKALQMAGIPGNQLGRFMSLMKTESSCNPRAQNNTDSNARAGMASRGLMQVIPPTFRANHCPGTSNNIFDPMANMCAAARYIKRRYGGHVPGSPYRSGTRSATAGWHMVGEAGPEMVRFGGGETVRTHSQTKRAVSDGGSDATVVKAERVGNEYHVHIHGPVYAKSGQDFENMLAGALQDLKRKRRLPR